MEQTPEPGSPFYCNSVDINRYSLGLCFWWWNLVVQVFEGNWNKTKEGIKNEIKTWAIVVQPNLDSITIFTKLFLLSASLFFFVSRRLLMEMYGRSRDEPKKLCSHNWFHFGCLILFDVVDGSVTLMMEMKFLDRHVTAIRSKKSNFVVGSSNLFYKIGSCKPTNVSARIGKKTNWFENKNTRDTTKTVSFSFFFSYLHGNIHNPLKKKKENLHKDK